MAIALPLLLLVSVVGLQILYVEYIEARIFQAIRAGARYASLLSGTNRNLVTEQTITAGLWGLSGVSFQFCPVSTLVSGNCPTGAGSRNAGAANDLVYFRAETSFRVILWPTLFNIKAEKVIKNEAF
jgi:hypothetical protein